MTYFVVPTLPHIHTILGDKVDILLICLPVCLDNHKYKTWTTLNAASSLSSLPWRLVAYT